MKIKNLAFTFIVIISLIFSSGNVIANEVETDSYYSYLNELKFREEFGLKTQLSEDNIILFNNDKTDDSKFGIKLTRVEEEQLSLRIEHQLKKLPLVKNYLHTNNYENDTIVFIDQKLGGVLNVGIKNEDDKAKYESDLKQIYGDPTLINVFITKYTEQELIKINERLLTLLNVEHNGVIITDTLINLPEQKVEVGVKNLDLEKRKVLEEEFNSDMLLIRESSLVRDQNRSLGYNPLQAGTSITNANGGLCTLGFMAKYPSTSSGYIITAAHCGSTGNNFKQGTNNVGSMGARIYGGNVDAAAIGISSLTYSNNLYTNNSRGGYFDLVQNSSNEFVGEMICISGASSSNNPVSCGVLKSKSVSYTIEGVNFTGLRSASYSSNPGDSGGPIYYSSILKGVHKGRYNGDGTYSHVGNVLSRLQMNAILN
ncbi:S1 family peptidase [Paenibacillus sp. FSL W8-0187]|uniref:S1 family peptidase n=1 Tax=Paenibacillus sp. FSL W8-0187 TaxID=2921710 RepID=UPI0030DAE991